MRYDHRKLGITFAELGALLGTRALLAAETLEHAPSRHDAIDGAHAFNMEITCERNGECGTVSCIGGTMGLIMGMNPIRAGNYVADARGGALTRLFYPNRDLTRRHPEVSYHDITTLEAIAAIDNFLAGRGPRWAEVLGLD